MPILICCVGAGKLVPASARSVGVAQRAKTVGGRGRLWGDVVICLDKRTRAHLYICRLAVFVVFLSISFEKRGMR